MYELTFEIDSNEEIFELLDKSVNNIFIHKFVPNEILEWWKTDLKIHDSEIFENLSVRYMEMDVQTDLSGMRRILDLNTRQLRIYQFTKVVSDTFRLEHLPENNRDRILEQNGLKHFFCVDFEMLTISSSSKSFIQNIENHPKFEERIKKRKEFVLNQKSF